MKQASLTPFCAISLMLIASLLFVMLEAARVYGLDYYAAIKAEAGIDSVCAAYQPLLWQQYGLLVLDGAYGTEHYSEEYVTEELEKATSMQLMKEKSFASYIDLFQINLSQTKLQGLALLTDEEGALFLNFVAESMKEDLPIGVAEDIYEVYQEGNAMEKASLWESVNNATQTLEKAKSSKWHEIEAKIREAETEEEEAVAREEMWVLKSSDIKELEKLFHNAKDMQASATLNLILGDLSKVSTKSSKPQSDLATREKDVGTIHYIKEKDLYRKILVSAYLDKYFSSFVKPIEEHFLSYEMEYVLCGKDMEWQNLQETLQKILLVRETANFTYLLKDIEKMKAAESMASAIGLLVGENPAAVKIIQLGIIAAWAYAESVLDVRALVRGERIPVVKSAEEWTVEVSNLFSVFETDEKAKVCETGLRYEEYVRMLLLAENEETLAFRMMEAMEQSLHANRDYQNCQMNHMIVALQYQLHFESNPLFSSMMLIGESYDGKFHFIKEVERSYIP